MSLSLTAFVPHSPMLLPAIGKNNLASMANTTKAYQDLTQILIDKGIETVILISPLGLNQGSSFSFNLVPNFHCNFESFGDLATKFEIAGDLELAHQLKQELNQDYQVQLTSADPLDYGSAVPLFFFHQALPKLKVLPLYPATTDLTSLFAFGQILKHAIDLSPKKIAVIASGSLSQRLNKTSPAGYSPKARGWDKKILKALQEKKYPDILNIPDDSRTEVKELGLNTLSVLLGCVADIDTKPKQLSYEYPFGIGLLVYQFEF